MTFDKEARRKTIGSSDSPAVLGVSPWKTALEVYLEKTGQMEPWEGNQATKSGLMLEDVVAQMYHERTGYRLCKPGTCISAKYPFLSASIDRLAVTDGDPYSEGDLIVELKTARTEIGWGEDGTSDIPDHYWIQVQHQMLVMNHKQCSVAVLIGGQELRVYHIDRNYASTEAMVKQLSQFWDRVQTLNPPPISAHHRSSLRLLNAIPVRSGKAIVSRSETAEEHAIAIEEEGWQIKSAQQHIDSCKVALMDMMGDAEIMTIESPTEPGRVWTVKRKKVKKGSYTVEPTEYTKLTVRKEFINVNERSEAG